MYTWIHSKHQMFNVIMMKTIFSTILSRAVVSYIENQIESPLESSTFLVDVGRNMDLAALAFEAKE